MVIIGASQALDPGSIPGRRTATFWGISSIGRVRALQARGTGIETPMLHQLFCFLVRNKLFFDFLFGNKKGREHGGIEPPTSRTLSENHTTRPMLRS